MLCRIKLSTLWPILTIFLLAACDVQVRDYPARWPAQRSQWFGCPEVSGTYLYKGEYEFYNGEISRDSGLFAFLPMGEYSEIENARRFDSNTAKGSVTHLVLSGTPDANLSVTARTPSAIVYSGKIGDFAQNVHCHRGTLILRRDTYQNDLEISRATDGSLVVKNSGLDCIFLLCNYKGGWGRWLPLKEKSNANSAG